MGFFSNKFVQIAIFSSIPIIGSALFGIGTSASMYPWYNEIRRPSWGPPDWVFGPVWTFLFFSMGYASYRVYQNGGGFSGAAKVPLIFYIISLLLNWTWTQVFFGFHLIGAATIHIFALTTVVIITGVLFGRVNQVAGVLFIPYAAWLSFASILSFTIWRLNS